MFAVDAAVTSFASEGRELFQILRVRAFFDQLAYFLGHKIFLLALYEIHSRIVQTFNRFCAVGFIRLTSAPVIVRAGGVRLLLDARAVWLIGWIIKKRLDLENGPVFLMGDDIAVSF